MKREYCEWSFPELTFQNEESTKNSLTEIFRGENKASLIRESIQNSIDAAQNDNLVRFEVSTIELKRADYPNLFKLEDNLRACRNRYLNETAVIDKMIDCLDGKDSIRCLKLSDYGTTGMEYRKRDLNSPFYSFTNTVGNSCKSNNYTGGSHGYGKGAMYLASKIRTLLVSSRDLNGNQAFIGRTLIASHEIDNVLYIGQGIYNVKGSYEAVTDNALIPDELKRTEPGTDILILCNEEITKKDVVREVLKSFFGAIFKSNGKSFGANLEVSINLDCKPLSITRKNFLDIAKEYFDKDEQVKLNPLTYITMLNQVKDIATVTKGENYCIRKTPDEKIIVVQKELEHLGQCALYLMKNTEGEDIICKMRKQGMTITYQRMGSRCGYVGLFWCLGDKGNAILKKCEDASHTQWNVKHGTLGPEEIQEGLNAIDEVNRFIRTETQKFINPNGVEGMKITLFDNIIGMVDNGGSDNESEQNDGDTISMKIKLSKDVDKTENKISSIICKEDEEGNLKAVEESISEDDDDGLLAPGKAEKQMKSRRVLLDDGNGSQSKKSINRNGNAIIKINDEEGKDIHGKSIKCTTSVNARPTKNGIGYFLTIMPIFPKGKGSLNKRQISADVRILLASTEGIYYPPEKINCDTHRVVGNIIKDVTFQTGVATGLNIEIETKLIQFKQSLATVIYVNE